MTTLELWAANLDTFVETDDELVRQLPADELARAARFVHAMHRRRHLAAHLFLRSVLAERVGRRPRELELVRDAHGKPRLQDVVGTAFSLSHSGGMGVCAVADQEVGVDLEPEHPVPDADAIAARILAPARLRRWRLQREPERDLSLLVHWTRYEALAKAEGGGLVSPPAPLDLDPARGQWLQVADRGERWSILTLGPAVVPGCIVSVAIRGATAAVSLHAWHGHSESATLREP